METYLQCNQLPRKTNANTRQGMQQWVPIDRQWGKVGKVGEDPKGLKSTKIEMIQKSCKINRLSDGGAVCLKHSPSAL